MRLEGKGEGSLSTDDVHQEITKRMLLDSRPLSEMRSERRDFLLLASKTTSHGETEKGEEEDCSNRPQSEESKRACIDEMVDLDESIGRKPAAGTLRRILSGQKALHLLWLC